MPQRFNLRLIGWTKRKRSVTCNKCIHVHTKTTEECIETISKICTFWIRCSGMEAEFTAETSDKDLPRLHGVTSQTTAGFIVTALRTSDLLYLPDWNIYSILCPMTFFSGKYPVRISSWTLAVIVFSDLQCKCSDVIGYDRFFCHSFWLGAHHHVALNRVLK